MRKILFSILCLASVFVLCFGSRDADAASLSRLLQEADKLLAEGDVAEALAAYQDIQVEFPEAEAAQFGIGCAQYIMGVGQSNANAAEASAASFSAAEEVFRRLSIAKNKTIRERAAYNRANTVAQTAKMIPAAEKYKEAVAALGGAVSAYEGVLRDYPEHRFAAQNLNHVRFLLKELLQNPPESEEEEKSDEQEQKPVSVFSKSGSDMQGMDGVRENDNTVVRLVPEKPKGTTP